jgi:hypothetical protein
MLMLEFFGGLVLLFATGYLVSRLSGLDKYFK